MRAVRWVINTPARVFGVLVPLLVAFWFLAGVGGERTPSDGGLYYVGAGFWVAFGLTFVFTLFYALGQLVRLVFRRSPA